jgi:arginine utilization regulatory protein
VKCEEKILKTLIENLDEGIHIVDREGRTIYYNNSMGRMEGLKTEEVQGRKVIELLKGIEEDSSTLMNALRNRQKYTDIVQHYSSHFGKEVTTINTTIPVIAEGEVLAAIEISKDMTQLRELNEKLCKLQGEGYDKAHYSLEDIVSLSSSMQREINKAKRASITNSSVLIYGETGCGKELFAQGIHYSGLRRDKPFVPINCAAIPSALLEGLLFGTVKGSFTGAENKKGLFEEASGGTVLLDEINSMDPALQSKLLRVLQDGYIRPIGSSKDIDIDIRIIATLNDEPGKLIKEGKLRKDFYYRLSVVRIDVPPLRERKEDIPVLTDYFLRLFSKNLGKNIRGVEPEVIRSFMNYDWPGNVRELKNTIEWAANIADFDCKLSAEHFEKRTLQQFDKEQSDTHKINRNNLSLEEYLSSIEKEIIGETLKKNNCNITKTAEELKISRQSLQYKMKKYKLP